MAYVNSKMVVMAILFAGAPTSDTKQSILRCPVSAAFVIAPSQNA